MKRSIVLWACLLLAGVASSAFGQEAKTGAVTKPTTGQPSVASPPKSEAGYVPVHTYDPARNADDDIAAAIAEAARTNKRVLLEVGGLWCSWCHRMDAFFEKHTELLAYREKNYVMVKVNYSDENKNEAALSRYPQIVGYPHLFVLGSDGKLLHSQDTGQLEEGKGYDLKKFEAFLKEWAPAPVESGVK